MVPPIARARPLFLDMPSKLWTALIVIPLLTLSGAGFFVVAFAQTNLAQYERSYWSVMDKSVCGATPYYVDNCRAGGRHSDAEDLNSWEKKLNKISSRSRRFGAAEKMNLELWVGLNQKTIAEDHTYLEDHELTVPGTLGQSEY